MKIKRRTRCVIIAALLAVEVVTVWWAVASL